MSPQVLPVETSTESLMGSSGATDCMVFLRISATFSAFFAGHSTRIESWIWRICSPRPAKGFSRFIMARFMRSASVPWMGMLQAARLAASRTRKLVLLTSGVGRRRP